MALAPNQVVPLIVEKPAAGGRMIGRVDGQVVLVGGAVPGERVTARVERVTKSVAFAETIAVEDASPDRRAAFPDPQCGGCVYSHIAYPRQLAIKGQVIADAFARIARVVLPAPVTVAASPEEGYRMRARLHVRGGHVGFFREGTHDLCDARQTRQLLPATCDALDRVMAVARSLGSDTVRGIELSENVDATERVVHADTSEPLDRRALDALTGVDGLTAGPYVTDAIAVGEQAFTLRRHVRSFFQGNRFLLRDLVAHVVDRIPAGGAVADLYAGVGLFAVAAAARGASVVAVEGDRVAFEDLQANARAAGGRIVARRGDVESVARELNASGGGGGQARFAAVIVDPPRTGMSAEALDAVRQLESPRLVYVSCDVATLARDARKIVDAGYTIDRADAFDLFPNTPHVETVVVFER
jgi:23S rRNA (uracil1939-C5)-methyltransferase